jgi:hypothetical protein
MISQPVETRIRPLLTNVQGDEVLPGERIVTVGANLSTSATPHDALFILDGPHGYRAQHLVKEEAGIAAATVTLPTTMAHGQWSLGVVDLADVTHSGGDAAGYATLDLGIFTVG